METFKLLFLSKCVRWNIWLISLGTLYIFPGKGSDLFALVLLCHSVFIALFILLFWQIWRWSPFPKGWACRGQTCVFPGCLSFFFFFLAVSFTEVKVPGWQVPWPQESRSKMILYLGFTKHKLLTVCIGSLIDFLNHHHRYFCLSEVWSAKGQLQVSNNIILTACSNSHVYMLIWHSFYETLDLLPISWLTWKTVSSGKACFI